ncbi:MAG: MerR family transcriptional regulator [Actinomycetota bacterium]|nr:MerR family transcriptional regulator [Actinomycetota bacterium]
MTSTVKDTAARVGLPSRTLRYYDRIGLVCPPRTAAGYRVYGPEEEDRLRFVRRAKTLGFSLEEIRELIAVAERGCCSEVVPEVERLLDEKIDAIDAQVAELGAFRERLVAFRAGGGSGCGCSGHGAFCRCLDDEAPEDAKAPADNEPSAVTRESLGDLPRALTPISTFVRPPAA